MDSHNEQGLILIPDITGFTEFVHSAKLTHAQRIVSGLLEVLIDSTQPDMELCEIEGDALLYFRLGASPDLAVLNEQAGRWFDRFHEHLATFANDSDCLCEACSSMENLSLKVVGHYGEIGIQKIGGRYKIMGRDVILAHRLLKNHVPAREYFLFTNSLMRNARGQESLETELWPHEETYSVFGRIGLNYINLSTRRSNPALPPGA